MGIYREVERFIVCIEGSLMIGDNQMDLEFAINCVIEFR